MVHDSVAGSLVCAEFLHLRNMNLKYLYVPRKHRYPDTPENRWFVGPVEPLNEGLKHVGNASFIARIDDDDEWEPNHLEKLLAFARVGNYEFVSSAHETHEGRVEPYVVEGQKVGGCQSWLWRSHLSFMKWNPDCWRKRWNKVNDTDLQYRFRKAGVRMGYLPLVTAKVMPRPGETEVGLKAYL